MDSVLIVAGSEKGKAVLKELLTMDSSCGEIITVNNGSEARRFLIERDCDLCIINAPLKDEFGTELAMHIAGKGISQVMLMIRNELADEISAKVEEFGVFVVSKPISRSFFWLSSWLPRRITGCLPCRAKMCSCRTRSTISS